MLEKLLDLVYPRVCGACGVGSPDPLCEGCVSRAVWTATDSCPVCGADRPGTRCGTCAGKSFEFRRALALGSYAGTLRDVLLAFKFKGERSLARPLARRLADRVRAAGWAVDLVVFVPMSRWKLLWSRRYNAAEVLAERLARELGKPLFRGLRKIRKTRAQMSLPLGERLENPRDAYRAGGAIADRAVLLVDDVLTSGATASACAKALYAARAREVSVAVVARSMI